MWGDSVSDGNTDVAGAMAFLFSALHGSPMSWSDVMSEGIRKLTGVSPHEKPAVSCIPEDIHEQAAFQRPEPDTDSDLLTDEITQAAARIDIDGEIEDELTSPAVMDNLKTKTMAEVLASQGDLEGALDIYRELLCCASESEKDELMKYMAEISERISHSHSEGNSEADAEIQDPYHRHAKNKLMSTLEILAGRLEARANS